MNIYIFNKQKNRAIIKCIFILAMIFSGLKIAELMLHNATLVETVSSLVFTWVPLLVASGTSYIIGRGNTKIKYVISCTYLVFYTYLQFGSYMIYTLPLIYPLLLLILLYGDAKLVDAIGVISVGINLISYLYIHNLDIKPIQYINMQNQFFNVQMIVLVTTIILLHRATIVLRHERNKLLQLNDEIVKDGLTNVYTRYFLDYTLTNTNLSVVSLTLAIIDVDNFKGINDKYGHAFGDAALKYIGKLLNKYTKKYDGTYPIRIGGDEFIIISYSLDTETLYNILIKMTSELKNTRVVHEEQVADVTLSIGIANNIDTKCKTYNKLYEEADNKLYLVKCFGKSSIAK